MHYTLLLIGIVTSLATSASLPKRDYNLPEAGYPGPIPYPDQPGSLPQKSIDPPRYSGKLQTDQQTMLDCLEAYSMNQFYDSWIGNECGDHGWYKGAADSDKISPYECYQTCALYLRKGISDGTDAYQCDYRKSTKGHCWLGYQPLT